MTTVPVLLFTLATLSLCAAGFVQAADEVEVQAQPVADQLYMLQGQGGNIGLFTGPDGTFMIDDQFAPLTEKILHAASKVGGEMPRILINTHFHGDHTGGNEHFGQRGALIIGHDNVRSRLQQGTLIKAFSMKTLPQEGSALPVLSFTESIRVHLNDETIEIFHLPRAHTDGDSVVHFTGRNVIHTGDLFFNGFYPFIDVDHGGSLSGMIAGVDRILALADDDTLIIPGHGPLARKPQLQAYRTMLGTAYERLKALHVQGKSLPQVLAAQPLADLEPLWGKGFLAGTRWIEIVYPGLD
ncbi:MAG: MBL fold metallo-hydrolase [Motiliproteus sp.]